MYIELQSMYAYSCIYVHPFPDNVEKKQTKKTNRQKSLSLENGLINYDHPMIHPIRTFIYSNVH